MKVRLLNRGGFAELNDVAFPVDVEASHHELGHGAVRINSSELYRIGAEGGFLPGMGYTFFAEEVQVIEE